MNKGIDAGASVLTVVTEPTWEVYGLLDLDGSKASLPFTGYQPDYHGVCRIFNKVLCGVKRGVIAAAYFAKVHTSINPMVINEDIQDICLFDDWLWLRKVEPDMV